MAHDDRRHVEVGAVGREPVLRLERPPIERDDGVRQASRRLTVGRGGAPGLAARPRRRSPRRACRPHRRRDRPCRPRWRHRSSTTIGLLLLARQVDRPHGVRRRAASARRRRIDDAVHPDERRRSRARRQERHGRCRLGAVTHAQRAQETVAAEHEERIDAAERHRRDRGRPCGRPARRRRSAAAGGGPGAARPLSGSAPRRPCPARRRHSSLGSRRHRSRPSEGRRRERRTPARRGVRPAGHSHELGGWPPVAAA